MPLVQSVTGAGATLVLNGVAAGNALFLIDSYFRNVSTGVSEPAPTDSNGTFLIARADAPSISGHDIGVGIFSQANAAAGTHTVTPQANDTHLTTLIEWSGALTSGLFDASVAAQNGSGTATSQATGTTGVTAQPDELSLIAFCMGAGTGSTNVGLTDPVTNYNTLQIGQNDASSVAMMHAYRVLSSAGAQSATFNWTVSDAAQWWQAAIATFKLAPSGSGINLGTGFHPGQSPGLGGISSARFQPSNWWPYSPPAILVFDPAFMLAMEKHGNDPLVLPPQVVASGMTPPEQMPT